MNSTLHKLYPLTLILSFFFLLPSLNAQDALSREEINAEIEETLLRTNEVYHWKNADDHMLWSTLIISDSLVSIGYQPAGFTDLRKKIHLIDLNDNQWTAARNELINFIRTETEAIYGPRFTNEYLMPFGEVRHGPFINFRVFNKSIVEKVRNHPLVRYFDPMSYSFLDEEEMETLRSDSGCGSLTAPYNSNDYTSISPQSRQSWHQQESNIDCAWNISNHGDGVWIAVIDTGVSDTNDKLGSEFDEGDSAGRVIEKYGFYKDNTGDANYDGWDDECGHGTSMIGLAAAPRGFDNSPAGVAYKANMVSYRGTEDVLINRATEKDGVSLCLYHAADDTRIDIISMSIGDAFSNGQVEDAVEYAYNKDKMIFAAAGTSFSFTTFFGVIFPAWMPETIAPTGIRDNGSTCNVCHDGQEVDFVVVMQRASDNDRKGVTTDRAPDSQGYVGGSSCATATSAGIAALVMGNHPTWTREQVLNRMISTADNFPNRDSDHGWGLVDVCQAVDPNFSYSCNPDVSNEMQIEITNISFPSSDDGFGGENEWVISLGGTSYYFDVSESGASGNPATYINAGICSDVPIILNLGLTSCGQNFRNITVESYEDDSAFSNCTYNSGDDHLSTTVEAVVMGNNTFSHSSSAGTFVFTYSVSCTPTVFPAASISSDTEVCEGDVADISFFGTGGTAPYTIEYTINGGGVQSMTTTGNTGTISHSTASAGTTTYTLVNVIDANGCVQAISGSTSITVTPKPTLIATGNNPITCGEADGSITLTFTNVPDGTYDIDYSGGTFTGIVVTSNSATISNLPQGDYNQLSMTVGICTIDPVDVTLTDPVNCCPDDYATGGNGALMGTETGVADYETDGSIHSTQIIDATAIVDYDSGTDIELLPGFETILGAVFYAFIDGCDNGGGGVNVDGEGNEDNTIAKEGNSSNKIEANKE